ncbi:MAG: pentapeptide repeat-containing protein [Spirochaetota bacterium]
MESPLVLELMIVFSFFLIMAFFWFLLDWDSVEAFYQDSLKVVFSNKELSFILSFVCLFLILSNMFGISFADIEKIDATTYRKFDLLIKILGGSGGLFALYLAYRRSRQMDKTIAETERNNKESSQRDRFTKAVEQLGNDKAEVRLGAIYTLDKIGKEAVALKDKEEVERIVNIFCSFVRERSHEKLGKETPDWLIGKESSVGDEKKEEKPRIDIQAVVDILFSTQDYAEYDYDLSFSKIHHVACKVRRLSRVDFNNTTFTQYARFDNVTFTQEAWFNNTTFTQYARFENAIFTQEAWFTNATFTRFAWFENATFTQEAWFENAIFTQYAWFDNTTFTQDAWFDNTTFTQEARFENTTFKQVASFENATFAQGAKFDSVTFKESTSFKNATFTQEAWFNNTTFTQDASFENATFKKDARFNNTIFTQVASFENVIFKEGAWFEDAIFKISAWFVETKFKDFSEISGLTKDVFLKFAKGSLYKTEGLPDELVKEIEKVGKKDLFDKPVFFLQ